MVFKYFRNESKNDTTAVFNRAEFVFRNVGQLVSACIEADEFAKRMLGVIPFEVDNGEEIMESFRNMYRLRKRKLEEAEAWEKYDNVIKPLLLRRADTNGLWYETWIDLEETWLEKWFASFRYMKEADIVEVCAKYLNEQERYYSSPCYYDDLNRMIRENA